MNPAAHSISTRLARHKRGNHKITLLPYKDVGRLASPPVPLKADAMIVCPLLQQQNPAEFAHGLRRQPHLPAPSRSHSVKNAANSSSSTAKPPLGLIEIKNMLRPLTGKPGAIICPANPGFYTLPQTIDDLVNMLVGRILDLLDIPHQLHARWNGKTASPEHGLDH